MYAFNTQTQTMEWKVEDLNLEVIQEAIEKVLPTLIKRHESWAMADIGLALVHLGYGPKNLPDLKGVPVNIATILYYGKLLKEMVDKELFDKRPKTFANAVAILRESKGQGGRKAGGNNDKEIKALKEELRMAQEEIKAKNSELTRLVNENNSLKKRKNNNSQLTEKEIKILLSFCHPDKFQQAGEEMVKKANAVTQILNKIK